MGIIHPPVHPTLLDVVVSSLFIWFLLCRGTLLRPLSWWAEVSPSSMGDPMWRWQKEGVAPSELPGGGGSGLRPSWLSPARL